MIRYAMYCAAWSELPRATVSSDSGGRSRRSAPSAVYASPSAASRRATALGASRASSSIREVNVLSLDDDALQPQVTVEHHEVGVRTWRQPHAIQAFGDAMTSEPVVAVGHAGGGGRIGHAEQTRNRSQRGTDRAGVDMQQIGNDLGVACVRQRRTDDARRAVMHGGHRVEQVSEASGAAFERGNAVLVAAQRVPDLDLESGGAQRDDDI